MGIAVPTQFVSTNDLLPTRNALSTMFAAINPRTGALPESGPPLSQMGSDTYHMWTLIGTYNYFLFSGDIAWLEDVWANYTKAVGFLENKVNATTGLIDITGLRDWARLGGGGYNAEGNAIYYKARLLFTTFQPLRITSDNRPLARSSQPPHPSPPTSTQLHLPLAEQAGRVSEDLEGNWGEKGPVAPELPGTVSPFISGFELQAHFEAGNDARAMDLLRRTWGYMLYTNLSVQSTLLEGFTANGSLGYRSTDGYNNDPSYTSHAHGWSSGPTSALTFYVLGLRVTSPQGKTWSLSPHLGAGGEGGRESLSGAEGGFETPLGSFGVKWTLSESTSSSDADSGLVLTVQVSTPRTTSGVFKVPGGMGGTLEIGGVEIGGVAGGQEVKLVGGESVVVLRMNS
ncbi:hypothetical protein C0995_015628 [Termitomyces sp. Mi166|nr:hypothetical protein C0995_015628 [Termitomyces sp. Mi166\